MAKQTDTPATEAAATEAATPNMTRKEFLAYFNDEVKPAAEGFGLLALLKKKDSVVDPTKFPAWFYSPDGAGGEVFNSPEEIPPGWLDAPPAAAE